MPGLMELQVKVVSALVNKGESLSTSGRLSENRLTYCGQA